MWAGPVGPKISGVIKYLAARRAAKRCYVNPKGCFCAQFSWAEKRTAPSSIFSREGLSIALATERLSVE
jgi:hypothetical protein